MPRNQGRVCPSQLLLLAIGIAFAPTSLHARPPQAAADVSRLQREAASVTIVRDDWGIAHVHGKTDADAVFGMIYAQAEDDFNRVETNYLTALGRLAEAEGEGKIYQDLRQRLFIDPADLKTPLRRRARPGCKTLMDAWADGLNYYLANHPEVKPRVHSPLRALDGAGLHRRQHRRRHRARRPRQAGGLLRQARHVGTR